MAGKEAPLPTASLSDAILAGDSGYHIIRFGISAQWTHTHRYLPGHGAVSVLSFVIGCWLFIIRPYCCCLGSGRGLSEGGKPGTRVHQSSRGVRHNYEEYRTTYLLCNNDQESNLSYPMIMIWLAPYVHTIHQNTSPIPHCLSFSFLFFSCINRKETGKILSSRTTMATSQDSPTQVP